MKTYAYYGMVWYVLRGSIHGFLIISSSVDFFAQISYAVISSFTKWNPQFDLIAHRPALTSLWVRLYFTFFVMSVGIEFYKDSLQLYISSQRQAKHSSLDKSLVMCHRSSHYAIYDCPLSDSLSSY